MEQYVETELKNYCELCKDNFKNDTVDYKPQRWKETWNSNQLIKFFQDKEILKAFLNSVIEDNIYCEFLENLRINIDEIDFSKDFSFEKEENKDIAKTDICIKSDKFICVIENKFGSKSRNNQCKRYREYIFENYPNHKKMFIYLDNEHNRVKISDNKFLENSEEYGGYYKALFGHNVLSILKNFVNHKKLGNEIKQYCNYLQETTLDPDCKLSIEIVKRRNELLKIIKDTIVEYYDYYDAIYIADKLFLDKYEYVNLLTKESAEVRLYLKEKLKSF